MESQAEKIALFRYGLIAPLVLEPLPRGRTHSPRAGDGRPSLRDPRFPAYGGDRRYLAGLGAPLSPRRFRSPRPPSAAGPGTVPHHFTATRRSHRTAETRESASHRHHLVARTGAGVGPRHDRPVGLHPLPLPQTARASRNVNCSLRPPTRSSRPNTPTRSGSPTCSTAPTCSAPAEENAGLLTRHPG